MPAGRHRKTVPARVRLGRIGVPAAASLVVATGVPVAVSGDDGGGRGTTPTSGSVLATGRSVATDSGTTSALVTERTWVHAVSRSGPRDVPSPPLRARITAVAATPQPEPPAPADLRPRWLTADLNVWSGPAEDTRLLTVLDSGQRVRISGERRGPWAQITRENRLAWVRAAYLVRSKPRTGSAAPVTGAACADGSSVESGLTANTVAVYRAVCAAFPAVGSWGGLGGGGDHASGRALDIMTGSSGLGTTIADYVRAHAGELGVSEVIWAQRIWSVERSGEGWRFMSDRGSTTANHYDHVHVSVY